MSAYNQEGQAVDAESMLRSKVPAKAGVGDMVAMVAATLLPVAMV